MIGLIAELGKSATARWLSSLALPALLFTAVVTGACLARGGPALDIAGLGARLTAAGTDLGTAPGRILVAALGFLLGASAAGGVVSYLADAVIAAWVSARPRGWVQARRNRAREADRKSGRKRPAAYLPSTLTPVGDQFQLAYERIHDRYETLDLTLLWPRLWLLIPKDSREVVAAAQARLRAAAEFSAWSLLYLLVGFLWWPAFLLGVLGVAAGYRRARAASAALAITLESLVDINQKVLADALGITLASGQITRPEADAINSRLYKRAFSPEG